MCDGECAVRSIDKWRPWAKAVHVDDHGLLQVHTRWPED